MEPKLVGNIMKVVNEALSGAATKKGSTTVSFDTKTDAPWKATFSQRGFSVEGTRLSFELLEDAISKEYFITLKSGQGLVLDAVKMQKILKYKTLY
jgi:hypothetical protein